MTKSTNNNNNNLNLSVDVTLFQNMFTTTNEKIVRLNNYVMNPKKFSNFFYMNNFANYNIEGTRLFLCDNEKSDFFKNKSVNLYSLISYYSSFIRNSLLFFNKRSSVFSGIIVCLLKGSHVILKYFARKYDQSFTSTFLPDIFTNSNQFTLTEYYASGNHFKFRIVFNPKFCWFFHSYNIKDSLLFSHLLRAGFLMFSFTGDNDMIESSDFFFPYNVHDCKTLYGGVILMTVIFSDLLFKIFDFKFEG